MTPIYQINALEHRYGNQTPALQVDRMQIAPSRIVGLVGPNGSGKSTLLKILAFIFKPSSGQVLFEGRAAAPFDEAVRAKVTILPQDAFLMKRSVFDNVAYGLKIRGNGKTENASRVTDALARVGLDKNFARRPWHALSGGEAQRVALAARLVLKPKVLLMDEPTASVDAKSARRIRAAALEARAHWGTTLVIASHDLHWLYGVCDDVVHLHRGRLLGQGLKTVINGPWQQDANGQWGRNLSEGSRFNVPPPPTPDAAAVIDADALTFADPTTPSDAGSYHMPGTVTRMILLKGQGIAATVAVGDAQFTVSLSQDAAIANKICPGRAVVLQVQDSGWRWLS